MQKLRCRQEKQLAQSHAHNVSGRRNTTERGKPLVLSIIRVKGGMGRGPGLGGGQGDRNGSVRSPHPHLHLERWGLLCRSPQSCRELNLSTGTFGLRQKETSQGHALQTRGEIRGTSLLCGQTRVVSGPGSQGTSPFPHPLYSVLWWGRTRGATHIQGDPLVVCLPGGPRG